MIGWLCDVFGFARHAVYEDGQGGIAHPAHPRLRNDHAELRPERRIRQAAAGTGGPLNEARFEIARSIAWSRGEEPPSHPEAVRAYLEKAPPACDPFCKPAGSFESNLTFAQSPSEAVKAVPGALLVASLPASDVEIGGEGGEVGLAMLKNTQLVSREPCSRRCGEYDVSQFYLEAAISPLQSPRGAGPAGGWLANAIAGRCLRLGPARRSRTAENSSARYRGGAGRTIYPTINGGFGRRSKGGCPMTPQERELLTGLFDRLKQVERNPKDEEAEAFIAQAMAAQPSAPYFMAQVLLVQDQALSAAQARIRQLQQEIEAARSQPAAPARSFLGDAPAMGPWGAHRGTAAPPASPSRPRRHRPRDRPPWRKRRRAAAPAASSEGRCRLRRE